MVEFNWTAYDTEADLHTGAQLNNLADGAGVIGEEINNTSNLDFYMDVELDLASVNLSGETNPSVAIYLLKSIDGTNFSDTRASASTQAVVIDVAATNAAHREVRGPIIIPPGKWKTYLVNNTGQAFTADANNHLTYRSYSEKSV